MFRPHPANPFASPSWRWTRCVYLADDNKPATSKVHDDPWTKAGLKFIRRHRGCQTDGERVRLEKRMPAIYAAHAIHQAEPPHQRWAVESRILADEERSSIARKCGTSAEAIQAYEKLFFDVRGSLEARDYICCQIIGSKMFEGMAEADIEVVWKFFGYKFGSHMLDAVMGLSSDAKADDPEKLEAVLARATELSVTMKAAIAGAFIQVNEETAHYLIRMALEKKPPAPEARHVRAEAVQDFEIRSVMETPMSAEPPTSDSDGAVAEPLRRRGAVLDLRAEPAIA